MALVLELSNEVIVRLEAAARARGISVEQLAAEALSKVLPLDGDFAPLVSGTIAEHRDILDSLAKT